MRELLAEYISQLKEDSAALVNSYRAKKKLKSKIQTSEHFNRNNQNTKKQSLVDFLPYIKFDPKTSLFENHNTIGFILRTSHFSGINENAKSALLSLINNDLPATCMMQVINYASPKIGDIVDHWYYSGKKNELFEVISKKRKNFFYSGSWQSILGNRKNWLVRDFELILCFSMNKPMSRSGQKEVIYKLEALKDKIIFGLKGINSEAYIMNDQDFICLIKDFINPSDNLYKNKFEVQNSTFSPDNLKSSFGTLGEVLMHKNSLEFRLEKNFHYVVFEVTNFPDNWRLENSIDYVGLFETGLTIPCPFYLSYGFNLKSRLESERTAEKYRMIKTKQGDSKLPMFFPKMIEEIDDWRYVAEMISAGDRLGSDVMYLVLCTKEIEKLEEYEQIAKDLFARIGFALERVKGDTLNSFLYTLPFGIHENWQMISQLKINSTRLSSACMNLMPVFADMQNYADPLMLLAGRRGQLFYFDNFKTAEDVNGNFNMIVVGTSGTGKSVFLEEYGYSILKAGGRVVILDDGRSFKNICALLDGDFVDFGGGDFCINPFSFYRKATNSEDIKEYQEFFEEPFIDLIVSILCIIINLDKNNQTDPEVGLYRSILAAAVQHVMTRKGSEGGFSDIHEELLSNPELKNKQTKHLTEKLEFVLRSYSREGRYAKYFNGPATLNIENDFTVFELSDLEHNQILRDATLMAVVFLVYAKMQDRKRRTVLAIDEFWKLGKHPALKGPIEGFARRGRKYQLSLILASQRMSDFDKSESLAGAASLSQSDWRILLSASGEDDEILRRDLQMSMAEIQIVHNLAGIKGLYSEFMIRHKSGQWQIGRLLLDKFSAKLFSTSADDLVRVKEMRKAGLSVVESIERLM